MTIKNGVYTALVTPFDEQQRVNLPMLQQLIESQIAAGIDGIMVLGTTGESPTISHDEKIQIAKLAINHTAGRVPVIVGTGTYATEVTIQTTLQMEELGADYALIVTPYYNKPTAEGIYQHFKAIANETSLPIIVYNISGRTGRNIDTPTLQRIADLPNIIGVKDSSGSVEQMIDVIDQMAKHRPDFKVFSGDDALTLPLISMGGHGIISVVSNLLPAAVVKMTHAALEGNFIEARKLYYELLPLFKGAFIETNPIPIKEAMNFCGIDVGGYRLPLCEMLPQNKQFLHQLLQQMDLCKEGALV
jgi:4-hydroxy-tetrahydrodipicolinate synthase